MRSLNRALADLAFILEGEGRHVTKIRRSAAEEYARKIREIIAEADESAIKLSAYEVRQAKDALRQYDRAISARADFNTIQPMLSKLAFAYNQLWAARRKSFTLVRTVRELAEYFGTPAFDDMLFTYGVDNPICGGAGILLKLAGMGWNVNVFGYAWFSDKPYPKDALDDFLSAYWCNYPVFFGAAQRELSSDGYGSEVFEGGTVGDTLNKIWPKAVSFDNYVPVNAKIDKINFNLYLAGPFNRKSGPVDSYVQISVRDKHSWNWVGGAKHFSALTVAQLWEHLSTLTIRSAVNEDLIPALEKALESNGLALV